MWSKLSSFVFLASLVLLGSSMAASAANPIKIPKGLSDTAFKRAFDNALEDAEPDQNISWSETYDTPSAQQAHEYFMNFTTFADTTISETDAAFDTRVIERSDVPIDMAIVEEYDTGTNKLIDYFKELYADERY